MTKNILWPKLNLYNLSESLFFRFAPSLSLSLSLSTSSPLNALNTNLWTFRPRFKSYAAFKRPVYVCVWNLVVKHRPADLRKADMSF